MKLNMTKETLRTRLPITAGKITIRYLSREDLYMLAAWPKYPFPFEGFEFGFREMNEAQLDMVFQQRNERLDYFPLVVDDAQQQSIGYIALAKINWTELKVGNLGFRIHPGWVNKGIGTSVLRAVCVWLFKCGFLSIGVDVAASNSRAIRCYENVGFYEIGGTWREAHDLKEVDITNAKYDFIRPHLRQVGDVHWLRFLLMEITPETIK